MPYLLSEILRPFLNILLAIGIFIGIGYILRLLRKKYVWADYLTYAIIILVPIWIWYINNKDIGALIGFGCMFSIPVYYTSGLNVKTIIRNNRGIYKLWCSKCRCKCDERLGYRARRNALHSLVPADDRYDGGKA